VSGHEAAKPKGRGGDPAKKKRRKGFTKSREAGLGLGASKAWQAIGRHAWGYEFSILRDVPIPLERRLELGAGLRGLRGKKRCLSAGLEEDGSASKVLVSDPFDYETVRKKLQFILNRKVNIRNLHARGAFSKAINRKLWTDGR